MRSGLFTLCFHAMAAAIIGAAAVRLGWPHKEATTGEDNAAALSRPGIRVSSPEGNSPSELLARILRDPYAELDPADLTAVACSLDITRESTWMHLDSIASVELRSQLWQECLRTSIGRVPLEKLVEISVHILESGSDPEGKRINSPIYEEIQRRGIPKEDLNSPTGRKLAPYYVGWLVAKGTPAIDIQQELESLNMTSLYQNRSLMNDCLTLEPTAAQAAGLFQVPPRQSILSRAEIAGTVWQNADSAQKALLIGEVTKLPDFDRNKLLSSLASSTITGSVDQFAELMDSSTSFQTQKEIAEMWLRIRPKDLDPSQLPEALKARNSPALSKISGWLAAKQ